MKLIHWSAAATLATVLALSPTLVIGNPIYKCTGKDGKVEFSNLVCPQSTSPTGITAKPNSVDMSGMREQVLIDQVRRQQEVSTTTSHSAYRADQGATQSECPDGREIRNMETRASSITLGKRERDFLMDEIRRARQCSKGQGRYSAADWQISREAQSDQSNLTNRDRARRRAEGMHSAADPIEGDRIAERQAQEEAARLAAQRARAFSCTPLGCMSPTGVWYERSGKSNIYVGPSGACTLAGTQMNCR